MLPAFHRMRCISRRNDANPNATSRFSIAYATVRTAASDTTNLRLPRNWRAQALGRQIPRRRWLRLEQCERRHQAHTLVPGCECSAIRAIDGAIMLPAKSQSQLGRRGWKSISRLTASTAILYGALASLPFTTLIWSDRASTRASPSRYINPRCKSRCEWSIRAGVDTAGCRPRVSDPPSAGLGASASSGRRLRHTFPLRMPAGSHQGQQGRRLGRTRCGLASRTRGAAGSRGRRCACGSVRRARGSGLGLGHGSAGAAGARRACRLARRGVGWHRHGTAT